MAYSINPYLPKARAFGMQLLIREQLPVQIVANRCGVNRSTIWRWQRKWEALNANVQLTNDNRPTRVVGTVFRLQACTWLIPTRSSRPHSSPRAISDQIVQSVLTARRTLNRCAEVVWHHLMTVEGICVSLSSVRRILRRHHCFDGARKPRVRYDNPRRPHATQPGELVQIDTIHHVDPFSGRRLYYYTVIDLYTRMAHASVSTSLKQGLAAQAILDAQAVFGFSFAMVQCDNGPEFSRYFEEKLHKAHIQTRHSRIHRPNDNAHIERFNRTIQTEAIGYYWRRSVPLHRHQAQLTKYLDYYNAKRIHLGIQMRVPREMLQRS